MKKKMLITMAVAMLIALPLSSVFAYEAIHGPTQVLKYDSTKAYDGYTIFSPMIGSTTAYLIDMEGWIVHEWECDYGPGLYAEILENGNMLRGSSIRATTDCPISFGGTSGAVEEIDWDGNVVWSYTNCDTDSSQHHTFQRLPNGNTFILVWEYHSKADAVAKGRAADTLYAADDVLKGTQTAKDLGRHGIWPDMVEEVDPNGTVVWSWRVWDHVGTGASEFDINQRLPMALDADGLMPYMSCADWTHFNTVSYLPDNDVMIVNSRNIGEWYLIDHNTTTAEAAGAAGDILYRWGNPSAYGAGTAPSWLDDGDQLLWGPHCALPINSDCPGYYADRSGYPANILIFDNGWQRPERSRSRAVEVNPNTGELVWEFAATSYNSFYTEFQGACQRLPNGNTFITSTGEGHFIEVTHEKEVVWEYINPVSLGTAACSFSNASIRNMVHRAHRYAPDYVGLAGRDLTQKWSFNEDCPVGPAIEYEAPETVTLTGWGTPSGGVAAEPGAAEAAGGGGGGY